MGLLLLEDDLSLIDGLTYALRKEGFDVTVTRTVAEAIETYEKGSFDFVLLDLTLPDGSGFDVCRKIRETSDVPVVFLTASDEEVHVVMGLDMGGDDYITKPFKLNELISRIKAIMRRSKAVKREGESQVLQYGEITMNLLSGKVFCAGREVTLTASEYKLLGLFLQNTGIVLTREVILDRLWDENGEFVDDNTLSVYIKRLRNKIEPNPSEPEYIHTIRGIGYRFERIQGGEQKEE